MKTTYTRVFCTSDTGNNDSNEKIFFARKNLTNITNVNQANSFNSLSPTEMVDY